MVQVITKSGLAGLGCYTKKMRKIIFGVFAHPDDEAFGPSGTLLMETKAGADLHLISLTLGEAGRNPDNHPDLGQLRHQEWQTAGRLMGAKSMHFLGYKDSQLDNQDLITAGQKIVDLVTSTLSEAPADAEVEFITSDLNGVTGHVDHIVAARAVTWAFYRLRPSQARLKRIRYSCLPQTTHPESNTDWLYMEAGRPDSQIDQIVDARQHYDQIVAIMSAHHSQRQDLALHIASRGRDIGLNYFTVKD